MTRNIGLIAIISSNSSCSTVTLEFSAFRSDFKISKASGIVSVRPSGTEPKIKFYFGAKGPDADAKLKALEAQFIS